MKGTISDETRIGYIHDCISEIENAVSGYTFEQFIANHVLRVAVVKWLQIIGEAANYVSDGTRQKKR